MYCVGIVCILLCALQCNLKIGTKVLISVTERGWVCMLIQLHIFVVKSVFGTVG